jgi:hypothetical protein
LHELLACFKTEEAILIANASEWLTNSVRRTGLRLRYETGLQPWSWYPVKMQAQRLRQNRLLRALFLVIVPPVLTYVGGMMLWPLWGEINYFDPSGNLHVVMPTRGNLWRHLDISEAWLAIAFGGLAASAVLKLADVVWRKLTTHP